MCTVQLLPGVNPTAVNKYIYLSLASMYSSHGSTRGVQEMPQSFWIWFESTCLFYFLNCVTQTTFKVLATLQATRIPGEEGYF